MTESKFETVSSLVDNYQLDDKELIDVSNDEQMSDTWSRYHLIGDVLRDDAPSTIDLDISLNIASAIAAEPTVLAPQRKTVTQQVKATVIKLAKPFGQVAIAASAATLMIVGVQQNVAQTEQIIPNQVVQTMPVFGTADPVSLNVSQKPSQEAKRQAYMEQQRRFQALLADHQQQLKLKQITVQAEQSETQVENNTQ
ncbi:sigma-E factor negative regulatory protein [Thalassotalea agariperforans]